MTSPDLYALLAVFPCKDDLRAYEFVPAEKVPSPYRELLVHEHHMTVTVEAHHRSPVDVRVLDRHRDGDVYLRKILLALQSDGRVVQYGIVRIRLDLCPPAVAAEIVSEKTPLGRILIAHGLYTQVRPTAFLRVVPGPALVRAFALPEPTPTYGRVAAIACNDQPAIDVLEIVTPEPRA